jgi:hypothetical protein
MNIYVSVCLPLLGLLVFSPQTHAELVSIETNTLLLSYNTEDLFNTGNLELLGNRLLFQPNLGVSVNSQTFDYSPPPTYTDLQSFSVNFTVQAKPGYRIDSHQVAVTGYLYQGTNSSVAIGLSGPFSFTYNSLPNYGTSVSAIGSSATPLPNFSLAGDVSINAESYYIYDSGVTFEQPIYGEIRTDEIIGYDDAVYDEFGNFISGTPIYRYENGIIGYKLVESYYPVYQINAASAGLGDVAVDFQVSAVPLPSAGWLFLGGLGMYRLVTHRRGKI